MKWTSSQKKAITEYGKNIIVSAGAGSGKTAVLTERVVNNIQQRNIKINEMLILTFTNASALEMKSRIKKRLVSDKENYELVDNSYITTFDSFCLSIVRRYSYLLDIPCDISANPYNGVIIESESKKILRDIFSKHYKENDLDFINLVKIYSLKDDQMLFNGIFAIYQDINKKVNHDILLARCLDTSREKLAAYIYQEIDKYKTDLKGELLTKINNFSIYCLDSQKHCQVIDNFINMLDNDLLEAINYVINELPRKNKLCSDDYSSAQTKLKADLKAFIPFLKRVATEEAINKDINFIYKNQLVIAKIIKELYIKLSETQKKNNLYSFNDIEMLAIKAIKDNEDVKKELRDSFKEIMIDEYQDTNDVQETLIKLIARDNVYQVGDIKQSIYRFRNANPKLFRDKYDKYSKGNGGIKIDLLENFRSREELINNFVNPIFSKIMTLEVGDADYQNNHRMVYGNHDYDIKKENYDLDLVDLSTLLKIRKDKEDNSSFARKLRSFNDVELEAIYICQDIKAKINKPFQILENRSFRNAKYSDFTIMCAKGSNFFRIKRIFEYYQIPLIIKKDEDIKENTEFDVIASIFSLLYYIINKEEKNRVKKQKYYLTSILRSYLYEKDDEYIYNVINNHFYNNEVYNLAISLTEEAKRLSPKAFFDKVVNEFALVEKATNISEIDSLLAKIDYLHALAATLDNTNYSNLDFISLIMGIKKDDLKLEYSTVEKNNEAVTLTTIHKSKGLQYNICYLIDIDSSMSLNDLKRTFVYYNNIMVTPLGICEEDNNTILHYILKSEVKKAMKSEMVRLYYVAFTRAKEKLVVLTTSLFDETSSKRDSFSEMLRTSSFISNRIILDANFDIPFIIRKKKKIPILSKEVILVNENNINYTLLDDKGYSKKIHKIITKKEQAVLDYGTTLHEYLEILDFHKPDEIEKFSLNDYLKDKLRAFLNLDIIKNLHDEKTYKEYEFIDDDSIGIIDLVIEYDKEIKVIDYKTSNIEDNSYKLQLAGYKNYLAKITDKKIRTYLYSIMNEELKEIIV